MNTSVSVVIMDITRMRALNLSEMGIMVRNSVAGLATVFYVDLFCLRARSTVPNVLYKPIAFNRATLLVIVSLRVNSYGDCWVFIVKGKAIEWYRLGISKDN
eukprot:gene5656-1661_t